MLFGLPSLSVTISTSAGLIRQYACPSLHPPKQQRPGNPTMPSDYAKTLGARLRAIRTQQGLSLHGVEEKSRGRWKAVVVGSYERGDRSVTVQKLAELADFYGVPVSELLPGDVLPTALAPSP